MINFYAFILYLFNNNRYNCKIFEKYFYQSSLFTSLLNDLEKNYNINQINKII